MSDEQQMKSDVKSDAICLAKLIPHKDNGPASCNYCDGAHSKDNICFHSEPWSIEEEEALERQCKKEPENKKPKEPMKTMAGYPLTPHEESCVRSLKRLARKWYSHTNRLWLFSANGHLHIMLHEGNGNREADYTAGGGVGGGRVNQQNHVCTIDIDNDGGDW